MSKNKKNKSKNKRNKKTNKVIVNTQLFDEKEVKTLNKYYNIAKVLLILSPFIGLLYLSMKGTQIGVTLPEAIRKDPSLTVLFLVSMINPFIAYLLSFVQKKLKENDVKYAVTNLVIFTASQIFLKNLLYSIFFGFILYKTLKVYNVTIKDSFVEKSKGNLFVTISGSLVVLFLSSICLFAQIRIGM